MVQTIMTDRTEIMRHDECLILHYIYGWDDDQSWRYSVWFTSVEGGVRININFPSGGYLLGIATTADEAVSLVTKDQEDAPVGYIRWCFENI